jgi:hypothetical protein
MGEQVKRAYYLLPNVREYGWSSASLDPSSFTSGSTSYQQYQKSYAFSLDWDEYADPTTAISCQDTFYEFGYNRVYTPSQFIDGYHNGSNRGRFIGIKEILDSTCDSTNNKFPTNDGVKNFDLIFILFNFFFSFITLLLIPLMVVVHILAFLWPILKILITFVYGTLATFVYVLCKIVDAIPFVNINCPRPPSFRDIFNSLGDPFKNIALPTITYPDCELCSCTQGQTVNENPDEDGGPDEEQDKLKPCPTISSDKKPISPLSSGLLIFPLSTFSAFRLPSYNVETNSTGYTGQRKTVFANDFAGYEYDNQYGSSTIGVPYLQQEIITTGQGSGTSAEAWDWFTNGLPIADRINLFNVKAKYFNSGTTNPGGGVNRITVNFQPGQTSNFHYDNTTVIVCNKETLQSLIPGQLISFQDPTHSKDINLTGGVINEYGNNAITGITSTGLTTIQIYYAHDRLQ